MYKKPPLGLIPKKFWLLDRKDKIQEAITRYSNELLEIPNEWFEELNEILLQLSEIEKEDKNILVVKCSLNKEEADKIIKNAKNQILKQIKIDGKCINAR